MRERASHARLDRPNGYSKLSGNLLVGQVAVFTEEENLLLLLTQFADRAPRPVDILTGRQFLGRRWVMRDGLVRCDRFEPLAVPTIRGLPHVAGGVDRDPKDPRFHRLNVGELLPP